MGTRLITICAIAALMTGCVGGGNEDGSDTVRGATTQRLVERDVEAPEVFQVADAGVWDGRPSLGGVWVAHPDTDEPERVIIRNEANGQFVIGALFRRDGDLPGPALQVSSDAAEALQMQAGTPSQLNVTALRREEQSNGATPAASTGLGTSPPLETASLDNDTPLASSEPLAAPVAPAPVSAPASTQSSSLSNPFIQIGIFSVERNAENTATALRSAGLTPTINEQRTAGKTFFRVTVGPAATSGARAADLETVKGLGFSDAYFVSG